MTVGVDPITGWMTAERKAAFIDVRSPEGYRAGHIPAERIAVEKKKLLKDKATPLIFSCREVGRTLGSADAASVSDLGYMYLLVFQGGMPEWSKKDFPVKNGDKPGSFHGARRQFRRHSEQP